MHFLVIPDITCTCKPWEKKRHVTDLIYAALTENENDLGVFLDSSKAFETVNHFAYHIITLWRHLTDLGRKLLLVSHSWCPFCSSPT